MLVILAILGSHPLYNRITSDAHTAHLKQQLPPKYAYRPTLSYLSPDMANVANLVENNAIDSLVSNSFQNVAKHGCTLRNVTNS